MKKNIQTTRARKGLITIINVVIIGGFMLGLMALTYRASIRSMEGQKKVQLQLDYEAREQAFLRSVVTLAPLYAANTMMDGSSTADSAKFSDMYSTAMTWSNMSVARDSQGSGGVDFSAYKNGNVGDISDPSSYSVTDLVGAEGSEAGESPSGVDATYSDDYPLPLVSRVSAAGVASKTSPLISSDITYSSSSVSGDSRDYKELEYPAIHFEYQEAGNPFIARHNWWKLYMHANLADRGATGVGNSDLEGNEYILSIYEIPSQLAISASSIINLGKINGTAWDSKISIEGPIFAKKANLEAGSISSIATKEGTDFSANSSATVGGLSAHTSSEQYEAENPTDFYPISKASDYSRSLFLPINPGLEFLDLFASSNTDQATGNRLSRESWNAYSRGCHQCKMKLIVTGVVSSSDQTPTDFSFYYDDGGSELTITVSDTAGADYLWPATDDGIFPFVKSTLNGQPTIDIHIDRLTAWLLLDDPSIDFDVNHSLVVNTQWDTNGDFVADGDIMKPNFPVDVAVTTKGLGVVLRGCEDLTLFDKGFSLVTSMRLYIMEDFNQIERAGGDPQYPPTSIFAPDIRIGEGDVDSRVVMEGQIGTLSTSSSGVEVLDIKGASSSSANAAAITATLTSLKDVNELPPVNMMNWLVVIQKKL